MANKLRPIAPLDRIIGLKPKAVGPIPKFGLIDPRKLFVEDDYQRNATTSSNSRALIKKIVNEFDWAHFKLPICSRLPDGKLVVIDGQHTSIAVVTHRGIPKIPVLLVNAPSKTSKAKAFVGHNKDRVGLVRAQIHLAAMASGDDLACEVNAGLERANVNLLINPVGVGMGKPNTTNAIGILYSGARKYKSAGVKRVLRVLVSAKRAPITAAEIAAVTMILLELKIDVKDDDLAKMISSKLPAQWNILAMREIKRKLMSRRSALGTVWLKALGIKTS